MFEPWNDGPPATANQQDKANAEAEVNFATFRRQLAKKANAEAANKAAKAADKS